MNYPPPLNDNYCNFSDGMCLKDYLDTLQIKDKSITWLFFMDVHIAVDDFCGQLKYVSDYGINKIADVFSVVNEKLNIDSFDLTLFYSDHGFKAYEDKNKSPLFFIGNARTQVMMFLHRKGEQILSYNNKLSSVMDIYPTLLNFCGVKFEGSIEGKDLYSEAAYDMLMIEDHKTFSNELGQTIERWAIRTEKGLACVDSDLKWEADYDITESEKKKFEEFISSKGSCFNDNVKMSHIHELYKMMAGSPTTTYFDGTRRIKRIPIYIRTLNFLGRMKRAIHNLLP